MPKLCAYSIIAYGINCFANIIFEEILPLFIASPKHEGGMEFSSGQMGAMMSVLGISALVVQLIFVPSWEKKYGLPMLNIVFLGIAAVSSLITPFLSVIQGPTWLIWGCLIVTLMFNIIGWGVAFTAQIVLINDTAPRGFRLTRESGFRVGSATDSFPRFLSQPPAWAPLTVSPKLSPLLLAPSALLWEAGSTPAVSPTACRSPWTARCLTTSARSSLFLGSSKDSRSRRNLSFGKSRKRMKKSSRCWRISSKMDLAADE